MPDDKITVVPAGYRLCTHGIKVKNSPMDSANGVVTIRFEEEAHVLGPDEICMVMERSAE